jgi:predicted phage terminase large subunit-like protein
LSDSFNKERAKLVNSEWFQQMWPHLVTLTTDRQDEIENSVGGRMTATSTGGTATGKGTHDCIVDDPLNPKQAASEVELKGSNEFFDETLRSRLSDQITGAFVIVMQRLDTQDLTGHVMEKEPGTWLQIRLPMEAEEDERWVFPISGRIVERKAGELLWPERFPRDVIEINFKRGMGSYVWTGQYQQRPTPREGNIIKQDWIHYWNRATLPDHFDEQIQSWDMAFEKTDTSSYVVGQVWGRIGARKLLLDEVHKRLDFVDTKKAVAVMTTRWPLAHVKLVEKKANGPAVIADLRSTIAGLIAVEPDGDKTARMMSVSPEYESGCVEYPDPSMPGYEWVREHVA